MTNQVQLNKLKPWKWIPYVSTRDSSQFLFQRSLSTQIISQKPSKKPNKQVHTNKPKPKLKLDLHENEFTRCFHRNHSPKITPHPLYSSFFISLSLSSLLPCKRTPLRETRQFRWPSQNEDKPTRETRETERERERGRERLDACTSAWYRGHASEIKRGDIEHAYYEAQRADAKFGWSGAGALPPFPVVASTRPGKKHARKRTTRRCPGERQWATFSCCPAGTNLHNAAPVICFLLLSRVSPLFFVGGLCFFRLPLSSKVELPLQLETVIDEVKIDKVDRGIDYWLLSDWEVDVR